MSARVRRWRALAAFAAAAAMVGGAASISTTTAAWVDQTAFHAEVSALETFPPLAETSHDAIAMSPGLEFAVLEQPTQPPNDADLCVLTMSVTNTTAEPLEWWVEFDVDLPPLWGYDPTIPGAFGLSRIVTTAFDAATGVWRIGGAANDTAVLAPGETKSGGMGYCTTGSGPQVPDDPSLYEVEVSKMDLEFESCLEIHVETTFPWAIRWSTQVDMLDSFTEAELAGTEVTTSQAAATPVSGQPYVYDVVGQEATELVAAPWGDRDIDRAMCLEAPPPPLPE
ncbi:hypothetical protein [Agromyces salentinus]|uniref:DUF4352 domain-containing protein n=1 Tax=Agromyces salentinus TaxID=269421 RepID=A0ABN2MGF4_9MICO|nr:hypothetical protein [Agromyces salentinus]